MIHFNEIVHQAIEYEKQYYLTDFDFSELLEYYKPSVIDAINDVFMRDSWDNENETFNFNRGLSDQEWDVISQYLLDNAADLLSIGYGYHVVSGYYTIASCDEIEIDLSQYRLTDTRREVINRHSDLYVSGDYGYVPGDFHLDINIGVDVIAEALLENMVWDGNFN